MSHPGQFRSGKPTGRRRVGFAVAGTLLGRFPGRRPGSPGGGTPRRRPAHGPGFHAPGRPIRREGIRTRLGIALQERPPGGEVRGGRRVRALPCGDRRDVPQAPDGPLARPTSSSRTIPGRGPRRPLVPGPGPGVLGRARGDRVFHKETKRDADGRVVSRNEAEARYVIGSGSRPWRSCLSGGRLPLRVADHVVFQEAEVGPVAGLPGGQPPLREVVKPACLFCHANRFDHVEGTENRYRQPIFQGHAIGCERCHGPGELHVRKPGASATGRRTS